MLRSFLFILLILSTQANIATKNSSPFALLAYKYFQNKDYQKAETYYKKSLLEIPEDVNSSYQLAKLYFIQKNYLNAFQYFRETLSIDKNYKDASYLFKESVRQLKFSRSLRNNPSKAARSFLIYQSLKEDQLSIAKTNIDRLIQNYPDYAFAWDHLALYYYKQKELKEAMAALKTALSLNANSPTIFKHYESTYYLLHHKSAPPLRKKGIQIVNNSNEDILKSLDQQIEKKIIQKTTNSLKGKALTKDLEASFLTKLLNQQSTFIAKTPKKSLGTKSITTKAIYVPIPIVNTEAEDEKDNMSASAANHFNQKNWELAYKIYQLLAENFPSDQEYKSKALLAKSYADFEFDFLRARSYFKKGQRNSENYTKSRNIFKKLDARIYFKLYQRHSFDDYLGRIAFTTGDYAQAEKHYKSWLKKEPKDIETIYLLLLAQNFQGKSNLAFETLKHGIDINRKVILSKEGISKLQIKLYVIHYWWLGAILILGWAILTFTYISIKSYRRKKTSGRKNAFELVKSLSAEGKWLEMIERVDALLLTELSPKEIQNLQYMKATGLYKAQQYNFAERQAKAIIGRDKQNKKALILLAKIYAKQESIEEECLESYQLHYENSSSPDTEFLRIFLRALKAAKQFTELAESVALSILKVDRYNQQALMDLVEIFLKRDNTEKSSIEIYQRYLELYPSNILVNTQYLKSLLKAQEYIEMIKISKKLIHSNPDLPEIHTHLIQAFSELGMIDEMNDYYQVLSLDYNHSPVVQQMLHLVESNYKSVAKNPRKEADRSSQNDQQIKAFYDLGRKYME
ncbi:tetratricopeptide repeat protein, partial [bacterium]|nr:tetratricopeptide repeat protein [bacterium]